MKKRINITEKGDTIVEVMLATAVLSLVLAGAFTISNRATRINQTANERTTVSNLLQREAELLKASHQQDDVAFWAGMTGKYESAENTSFCELSVGTDYGSNAFFMEDDLTPTDISLNGSKVVDAIELDLYDVWIEAVDGGTHANFFVFGCWEGIGGLGELNSGLVLRLTK